MLRLWREGFDLQAPLVDSSKKDHSCLAHQIMFFNSSPATVFSPLTTALVSYSALLSLLLKCLNEKPKAGHKQWFHRKRSLLSTKVMWKVSKTFPSVISTCHLNLCLFQINAGRSRVVCCHNMPTSISSCVGSEYWAFAWKRPWFWHLRQMSSVLIMCICCPWA